MSNTIRERLMRAVPDGDFAGVIWELRALETGTCAIYKRETDFSGATKVTNTVRVELGDAYSMDVRMMTLAGYDT